MIGIEISPRLLAKLLRGDSLVFRFEDQDFELYVQQGAHKDDSVGAALLEILPFIGEKH